MRTARRGCCEAAVTLFTVDSQAGVGEAVCVMGAAKWLGESMVGPPSPAQPNYYISYVSFTAEARNL